MVAPVTVVLRVLDVVLDLNDLDIILLRDEIGDLTIVKYSVLKFVPMGAACVKKTGPTTSAARVP